MRAAWTIARVGGASRATSYSAQSVGSFRHAEAATGESSPARCQTPRAVATWPPPAPPAASCRHRRRRRASPRRRGTGGSALPSQSYPRLRAGKDERGHLLTMGSQRMGGREPGEHRRAARQWPRAARQRPSPPKGWWLDRSAFIPGECSQRSSTRPPLDIPNERCSTECAASMARSPVASVAALARARGAHLIRQK